MSTLQRQSLSDTMREAGVIPCELPELIPGNVVRQRIEGDTTGSLNGWVYPFPDGAGCAFGSWKTGITAYHLADGVQVNSIERKRVMMEARRQLGRYNVKRRLPPLLSVEPRLVTQSSPVMNIPT